MRTTVRIDNLLADRTKRAGEELLNRVLKDARILAPMNCQKVPSEGDGDAARERKQ